MLVAPNGKCYCINQDTQQVAWSYLIKDRNSNHIYVASREDSAESYMDAIVNNGQICLCHCRSDLPPDFIEWISDDDIKSYMELLFGANVLVESKNIQLDLHFDSGKRVNMKKRPSSFLRIEKTSYKIVAHQWRLQFSKYQANFHKDHIVDPVHVYHTHEVEVFRELCLSMGVNDEEMVHEWWIQDVTSEEIKMGHCIGASGCDVFVKSFAKDHFFSPVCRKLWESNHSNHIVKFHGAKVDRDCCHLAFEYCPSTLHRYLLFDVTGQERPLKLLDIMRGLIDGLEHLHKNNICHGNLNPWNILLTHSHITKISGFGNFQRRTTTREDEDLRDLRKLIIFAHSKQGQLGLSMKDYAESGMDPEQMFPWAYEAKDLAYRLQNERLSLTEVRSHPWLWTNKQRIDFLKDASQFFDMTKIDTTTLKSQSYDIFPRGNWHAKLPSELIRERTKDGQGNYYSKDDPCHLLRFIRNILSHLPTVLRDNKDSAEVCKFLSSDKFAVEMAFRSLFPALLMKVYAFLRDTVPEEDRASLEWYFYGSNEELMRQFQSLSM